MCRLWGRLSFTCSYLHLFHFTYLSSFQTNILFCQYWGFSSDFILSCPMAVLSFTGVSGVLNNWPFPICGRSYGLSGMSSLVLGPAQEVFFLCHGFMDRVHGHGILRAGRLAFCNIMSSMMFLCIGTVRSCLDWLWEVSFFWQWSAVHCSGSRHDSTHSSLQTPQISHVKNQEKI